MENEYRKIEDQNHPSGVVRFESDYRLPALLAKQQGTHFTKFLGLAIQILQGVDADGPIGIHIDLGLTHHFEQAEQRGLRPPGHDVPAAKILNILVICRCRSRRMRIGKITVQEAVPHPLARAALAFSKAVVRDIETQVCIRHQVQVGMEIIRVAGMADDPVSVPRLLVEFCCHPVHVIAHCELASVHQLHCLGPENSCVLEFSVLQMRNHEFRHVSRSGRATPGRQSFHVFKRLVGLGRHFVAL